MDPAKEEFARTTNPDNFRGSLLDVLENADFFLGVSVAGALTR